MKLVWRKPNSLSRYIRKRSIMLGYVRFSCRPCCIDCSVYLVGLGCPNLMFFLVSSFIFITTVVSFSTRDDVISIARLEIGIIRVFRNCKFSGFMVHETWVTYFGLVQILLNCGGTFPTMIALVHGSLSSGVHSTHHILFVFVGDFSSQVRRVPLMVSTVEPSSLRSLSWLKFVW